MKLNYLFPVITAIKTSLHITTDCCIWANDAAPGLLSRLGGRLVPLVDALLQKFACFRS